MGTRVYVGNLSFNTNEESLRAACAADGRSVSKVSIVTDRETGQPRGFAFVDFASEKDAQAAIAAMNGMQLDGRNLMVNEAREREQGGRGGGGRGGPGGGHGKPRGGHRGY
jgi:RNA recognition motif-containing protein